LTSTPLTSTPFKKSQNDNIVNTVIKKPELSYKRNSQNQVNSITSKSIISNQIHTPKVTRISISSNNVSRYTPNKETAKVSVQRNQVRPSDAYNFNAPKIVRVSTNAPSRTVIQSNSGIQSKTISSYSNQRREVVKSSYNKPSNNVIVRSSNQRTGGTLSNRYQPVVSKNTTNYRYVNSKLLTSYSGNAHKVNAFSSKSGAVNYVNTKSKERIQPRVIRASQNIPKHSTRYEKLQTKTYQKSIH
jgi:hypothetical protein